MIWIMMVKMSASLRIIIFLSMIEPEGGYHSIRVFDK